MPEERPLYHATLGYCKHCNTPITARDLELGPRDGSCIECAYTQMWPTPEGIQAVRDEPASSELLNALETRLELPSE